MSGDTLRLLLVRHGRTAQNVDGRMQGRSETPLDAEGHAQAQRVAQRLTDFRVAALYTSPLLRAQQTAAPIGAALGLTPQVCAGLIEFDFGVLSGMTLDEVQAYDPALHANLRRWLAVRRGDPQLRPAIPGAESEAALAERIEALWADLLTAHSGETVAAVTHGGLIKAMFTLATGGDLRKHMPFWADNCSISILDFYRGALTVRVFNDVAHLGGELSYGKSFIL